MGWMDVSVAVLVIINVIRGWSKGLILTIPHMVGFFVAWIIAQAYYKTLSAYIIAKTNILPAIQELISKRIKDSSTDEDFMGGAITDYNMFQGLKLPKGIEELMKSDNVIIDFGARAVDGVYHYMAEVFARMFMELISFFLIFLVVKLFISIIAYVLDGIGSLPILKEFNRLGGGIIGGIKGLLIVFIILALLIPFIAITDNDVIMEGLEKSMLTKYMYDHNPIIGLMEGSIPLKDSGI